LKPLTTRPLAACPNPQLQLPAAGTTTSAVEDTYREAVLAVIKRKAKGEEIVEEPEETKQQDSDDLMAALEASL
jgi:DNA end-binding protein Ku